MGHKANTRTRDGFHTWLRDWVAHCIADIDGDEDKLDIHQRIDGGRGSNGRKQDVLVESPDGKQYILKGTTTLAGVTEYLFRLNANPDLTWDKGEEAPNGWRPRAAIRPYTVEGP